MRSITDSSLLYCSNCRLAFNTAHAPASYNSNYFLEEYQQQYGKTYEDDFSWIYELGRQRIGEIKKLSGKKDFTGKRLLDAGCALGFFLKAAYDEGFEDVEGLEISGYAADYCRNRFGFRVHNVPLEEFEGEPSSFNVITAWYVIEHSSQPLQLFHKLYEMLEAGGVLACSMPSIHGPMFFFHRDEWVKSHPDDHFIDFSPGAVKKALKCAGFRRIKCSPAAYHPERIIRRNSLLFPPFAWMYGKLSKMTCFSDTMHIYALK